MQKIRPQELLCDGRDAVGTLGGRRWVLLAALTDCVTHLAFSTCLLEPRCLFMALSSQADSQLPRFIFYPPHLTQSLAHSRQPINVCVET